MRATAAAFTLSLATALTAFDGAASQVMADASLEYAIKAAYLPKFAPFIEWPNGAFTGPSAPLTICVIGNDPFGANLDKAVEGQRDGEHPLVVRRLPAPDPTAICQILFTGDAALAGEALEQMKTRPVVTVTDSGLSAHGIISFAIVGNHVRFDIDAAAADRVGLNISSKLLSLAHSVRQKGPQ